MKKRTSSTEIIVPGESAWELWRAESGSPAGSRYSLVEEFEESGEVSFSGEVGAAEYGIASAEITSIPLWIQVPESETDAAVVMQLEGRGITSRQAGEGWHEYRIAKRDGGRRLAVISVLSGAASAMGAGSRLPDAMRPAADYFEFGADRVTLYREMGALVLAVTQSGELVYQSPLVAKEAGEEAAREIVQIVFQLKFDEVVGDVDGLDLWVEDGNTDALRKRTGLDVHVVTRPDPVIPGRPAEGLVTPDIAERREAKVRSARVRKIALTAGVVLSSLVFLAVAVSTVIGWKRDALVDEIAELTPRAAAVAADKGRWEELAPALDRDRSVLETLHRLSGVKSVRGVSLTKFEMAPGTITLAGKASAPGLVLKFGGEVTSGAFLPDYRWEFPAPAIANDNTATFELKGTRIESDETQG